jgi:hypothetical protein
MPNCARRLDVGGERGEVARRVLAALRSNQALAERALVIVSSVVKVLEAIRNSVLFGASFAQHREASSWPSMLETKWKRLPGMTNESSAATAICGPRSEPPMPMLTTSVMAASARTCSA